MDVFEKVQQTKPVTEGSEDHVAAARARLMSEIHAPQAPASHRTARRPWIIAGGLIGAAAAVTVGILVVGTLPTPSTSIEATPRREPGATFRPNPPTPPESPVPSPQTVTAASVLVGAASVVGAQSGPVAGPDQYLKVVHNNRQLVLWSPQDPVNSNRTQATAAWVVTNSYTSYIPGDTSREWVDVFDAELQVVELFGDEAAARSEEWLANFSWKTEPMVMRYQDGGDPGTEVPSQTHRHYADMPRDPAALLAWVKEYQTGVEPGTEDMAAVTFLMQELQLGHAPADLRAAMYRALSIIPNGVITGTDGDIVTLSFLTYPPNERWDSISIDTRTALVTSVSMTLGSGGTVVPDDVPSNLSTLTISVVDEAP